MNGFMSLVGTTGDCQFWGLVNVGCNCKHRYFICRCAAQYCVICLFSWVALHWIVALLKTGNCSYMVHCWDTLVHCRYAGQLAVAVSISDQKTFCSASCYDRWWLEFATYSKEVHKLSVLVFSSVIAVWVFYQNAVSVRNRWWEEF